MSEIYQIDIKAEDYPAGCWLDGNLSFLINNDDGIYKIFDYAKKFREIHLASQILLNAESVGARLNKLDRHPDYPFMQCVEVFYKPRKWWQKLMFWKKKEIQGYLFKRIE